MSAAYFREIILAVTNRLVEKTIVPDPGRVLVTTRDPRDVPFVNSEMDILIRPRGFRPDEQYRGHGRSFVRNDRVLDVIPRLRDARDSIETDLAWLTDETLGYLAIEDAVVDALEEFFPTRDDGSDLLIVPMYLITGSDAVRGIGKDRTDRTWGYSTLSWGVAYQQAFKQVLP